MAYKNEIVVKSIFNVELWRFAQNPINRIRLTAFQRFSNFIKKWKIIKKNEVRNGTKNEPKMKLKLKKENKVKNETKGNMKMKMILKAQILIIKDNELRKLENLSSRVER